MGHAMRHANGAWQGELGQGIGQEGHAFEHATGRIVLVKVRELGAAVLEPANGRIVRLLELLVRVRVRVRARVGVRVRVKVEW